MSNIPFTDAGNKCDKCGADAEIQVGVCSPHKPGMPTWVQFCAPCYYAPLDFPGDENK